MWYCCPVSEVSTEALVGLPVWEAASSDGCCCCLCAASPSHSMVGWGLGRAALCLGGNGSLDSPLCCQLSGTAAWNSLEEWRPGGSDCWAVLVMLCAEITARLGFSLLSQECGICKCSTGVDICELPPARQEHCGGARNSDLLSPAQAAPVFLLIFFP